MFNGRNRTESITCPVCYGVAYLLDQGRLHNETINVYECSVCGRQIARSACLAEAQNKYIEDRLSQPIGFTHGTKAEWVRATSEFKAEVIQKYNHWTIRN